MNVRFYNYVVKSSQLYTVLRIYTEVKNIFKKWQFIEQHFCSCKMTLWATRKSNFLFIGWRTPSQHMQEKIKTMHCGKSKNIHSWHCFQLVKNNRNKKMYPALYVKRKCKTSIADNFFSGLKCPVKYVQQRSSVNVNIKELFYKNV